MKNVIWIIPLLLVCTQLVCSQTRGNHYQKDLDSVCYRSLNGEFKQISFIKDELSKKLTVEDRSYLINYVVDSLAIAKNCHYYLGFINQDDLDSSLIKKVFVDFIKKLSSNVWLDINSSFRYFCSINNYDAELKNKYRELKSNQLRDINIIERFYVIEKHDIEVMSVWYDDVENTFKDKSLYIDEDIYKKIFALVNNKYEKMIYLMFQLILEQPERKMFIYNIDEEYTSKTILLYGFAEMFSYSPYGFTFPCPQQNDYIVIVPDHKEFTMSLSYQEKVKNRCNEILKQYKQTGNSFKQYELK